MRLNLRLTGNTEPVPYNHLHQLTGAVHKWLGENDLHDALSLYSFGWLWGAVSKNGHLTFPQGATWRVSFHDPNAAKTLVKGILSKKPGPEIAYGMRVFEVKEQAVPAFSGQYRFLVDGAVLTRRNRDDGGRDHLTFDNPEADETLTRTLRHRLKEAGLNGEHLQTTARFDRSYSNARTKLVTIKGTQFRVSQCPVIIEGTPEAVRTAWLVGVGELTGSGLGALK